MNERDLSHIILTITFESHELTLIDELLSVKLEIMLTSRDR